MYIIEVEKTTNILTQVYVSSFFAWFWNIKKNKDKEIANNLLDKFLYNKINDVNNLFGKEVTKNYIKKIAELKIMWKNKYINFIQ